MQALSTFLPYQLEEQRLGKFIRGLQADIKKWLRLLRPTTCEKAIDLARHVATAITAPGERPSVNAKVSNYTSGSNLNLHDLTEQSIGPNSQTTQALLPNTVYLQFPLKPYKSPKLIVIPICNVITTSLFNQEGEDEDSNLKCNYSTFLKSMTSNSESETKTQHNDLHDEDSCLIMNLKDKLFVPAISLRSIDRLTNFINPCVR